MSLPLDEVDFEMSLSDSMEELEQSPLQFNCTKCDVKFKYLFDLIGHYESLHPGLKKPRLTDFVNECNGDDEHQPGPSKPPTPTPTPTPEHIHDPFSQDPTEDGDLPPSQIQKSKTVLNAYLRFLNSRRPSFKAHHPTMNAMERNSKMRLDFVKNIIKHVQR